MYAILNVINFYPDRADPRTINWFLMSSPWPFLALIIVYVKFSYHWGPRWMKNREPFQIDRIVQLYDIFQIFSNAYLFYKFVTLGWLRYYNWRCEPVDYSMEPRAMGMAEMTHFFFVTKIIDLLDTVFFIMRKKQSQVTFLHVYHHAIMIFLCWLGTRFFAGGHCTFIGLVNSLVHVVMYTHYLVMSLKKWKPWWKKHITQLQILQFFLVFYQNAQLWWVEDCGYPKSISILFIPLNFVFLWMFIKFYYVNYIKTPKNKESVK